MVAAADYEPLAREQLSAVAWAYLAGGAADEITPRENRAAFERLRLNACALAAAGAVGVAHVIQILRAELEAALALTGCPTLGQVDRLVIWRG